MFFFSAFSIKCLHSFKKKKFKMDGAKPFLEPMLTETYVCLSICAPTLGRFHLTKMAKTKFWKI